MKIVEDMPSNGQFLRIWIHDGMPWCETMRYNDGIVEFHDAENDEWLENFEARTKYTMPNSKFIVNE